MKTNTYIEQAKQQLKGKYLKYVGILFLCTMIMTILNTGLPVDFLVEHPEWYVPYLIVMIILIVSRNTIYFLFIKRVRSEVFQMRDVRYSFTKTGTHILSALLFEIIQMGILMVIQMIGSLLPIVVLPLIVIVQVILASVSVFIAFAIYDGVKGSLNIVNGSFRLLKQNFKTLFLLSLPFLIWLLVYQLADNLLSIHMITNVNMSVNQMLEHALQSADLVNYAYAWIGLSLLNTIVSCFLLVPLYTAFANVYEQDYIKLYPFRSEIRTNVIDIDDQN